ncbi:MULTISPECIES: hypothetical protein [unclassified Ornithinimicrobium]|uniref:hypothetical protein n=1 Tax=unclassified Ornithinimicrobium TaxID=2615080 RepID=UPI003853185A
MSFWDALRLFFISFALVAHMMVLFSIVTDLFRDEETSDISKALWKATLGTVCGADR